VIDNAQSSDTKRAKNDEQKQYYCSGGMFVVLYARKAKKTAGVTNGENNCLKF